MNYAIDMPRTGTPGQDKENLKRAIPYLVWDYNNKTSSTIIVFGNGMIVWFGSDGHVGCSGIEYLLEPKYLVIREYCIGEKLVVTRQ